MSRFAVKPNGAGGFRIWDSRQRADVSECSHRRNAVIMADRLNYSEGGERAEWFRFYNVKESA